MYSKVFAQDKDKNKDMNKKKDKFKGNWKIHHDEPPKKVSQDILDVSIKKKPEHKLLKKSTITVPKDKT